MFVIAPEIGVTCAGHQAGLGLDQSRKPPLLCYKSVQKPGTL